MATMVDVARDAGVSLSTVSYALSGVRPVSEATKQRINESIQRLGFRRNAAAASLASRRTYVLAILYPFLKDGIPSTVADMIAAVEKEAQRHGYEIVIWPQSDPEVVVEMALEGKADALIVMEVLMADRRVAELRAAGIPVSLIGRTGDDVDISFVDVDFAAAVAEAVARLADLGHRHMVFINHFHRQEGARYGAAVRASEAFTRELAIRGIEGIEVQAEDNRSAGEEALEEILERHPNTTALVIMNEKAAFGVTGAAPRRGVAIPEDLSIISIVTSTETAENTGGGLTSLDVRGEEIGHFAAVALMESIGVTASDRTPPPTVTDRAKEDPTSDRTPPPPVTDRAGEDPTSDPTPPPRQALVPCDFVDRGSIAPPRTTPNITISTQK
nr:LacI family transcriptional regulator [Actinomycetales bacterium]